MKMILVVDHNRARQIPRMHQLFEIECSKSIPRKCFARIYMVENV
jgi:hypothetical protein